MADGAIGRRRRDRTDRTDGEVGRPCPTARSTARVARVIRTADSFSSRKPTSTKFGVPSSCWSDLNGLKSAKSTNLVAQSTGRTGDWVPDRTGERLPDRTTENVPDRTVQWTSDHSFRLYPYGYIHDCYSQ